jgi:cytochrome b6-f complex iron-sulfur subunit
VLQVDTNLSSGRREFVCRLGAACTALAAARCGGGGAGVPTGPVPGPLTPPGPTPPDTTPSVLRLPLPAVGATVGASAGNLNLAITRVNVTTVVAVSRTCTHQGCLIPLPEDSQQTLDCSCHGSRFTTAGAVVMGPAERALQTFPASIEGSEVVVTIS